MFYEGLVDSNPQPPMREPSSHDRVSVPVVAQGLAMRADKIMIS